MINSLTGRECRSAFLTGTLTESLTEPRTGSLTKSQILTGYYGRLQGCYYYCLALGWLVASRTTRPLLRSRCLSSVLHKLCSSNTVNVHGTM